LQDVVDADLDAVRPTANAKDITLAATLAEVGPMQGAPDRLQQVVWNIVTNAVKFTPRGGRIDVVLRRADSYAEVVVTDRGEGISPVRFPRVLAGRQLLDTYAPRAGPRPYVGEASRRTAWWPRAGRERGQRHGRHVHCGAAVAGLDGLQRPTAAAIARHRTSGSTGFGKWSFRTLSR